MKLEHLVGVNNEIFPSLRSNDCKNCSKQKKENEENPLISVDLFTFARSQQKMNNDDEKN